MPVSGGSQSFNAVNQLRVLGRWMRMSTIPNQSSVPKAFLEFDETDRMKPSSYYDRVVEVMEELMKFTLLVRDRPDCLVDRYSERKESAQELCFPASAALHGEAGGKQTRYGFVAVSRTAPHALDASSESEKDDAESLYLDRDKPLVCLNVVAESAGGLCRSIGA